MQGDPFSNCGSRLSAAHIRHTNVQELHRLSAVPFQNLALALAPRTFASNIRKSFTDSHDQRTRNCGSEGFSPMK
eukprot:6738380-Pyramimonas_sp.AAC.1